MMLRIAFLGLTLGFGLVLGGLMPQLTHSIRALASADAEGSTEVSDHASSDPDHGDEGAGEHGDEAGEADGIVRLDAGQIDAAQIDVAPAGQGDLERRISLPGIAVLNTDRVARIPVQVVGTVSTLRKRLGDDVAAGEVVAVVQSREVAEARGEYLAAAVNFDLQNALFERETALWEKRISAEQQFLRARAVFTEARLRVDLARQKLSALDVDQREAAARDGGTAALGLKEVRSPIAGRVVERFVDLGAPVGGEGQAKELFVVADLSSIWVELSVPTSDMDAVREGQKVVIGAAGAARRADGRIIFIGPSLDQETRSARVVVEVANEGVARRPGSFVDAEIVAEELQVAVSVPRTAVQRLGDGDVVFLRTPSGFQARKVALGRGDERLVEVTAGLQAGDMVAVENTFVLKAELGKSEAEHAH